MKQKQHIPVFRLLIFPLAALLLCLPLAGCSAAASPVTSLSQLNDPTRIIAVQEGAGSVSIVEKELPQAQLQFNTKLVDSCLAVQQGKADALAFDRVQMVFSIANGLTGVKLLDDAVGESINVVLGISRKTKIPGLQDKLNTFIAELKKQGVLDDMFHRWVEQADSTMPDIAEPKSPSLTLRVGTTGLVQPFSYYQDNELAGYDIELILRLALYLNAKVEIRTYDFGGVIAAAESGAIDCIASNLNATEERRQVIDFSDPLYQSDTALMVRDETAVSGGSFFSGLKDSFIRTFLTEDRWVMVVSGLGVTALISFCSGVLGTLLGFGICMLRRNKSRAASLPAAAFIRVIQGTPIVVLLLILYYLVFGSIDAPAILVAILAFSINFGVYASEMMRTGIEAVDSGQVEAAYALGFSRRQAFWKITFPQAARHFLPVFKGEFISTVKMTSVVGYIAIQDLTKVSDIIRSRTLEAFFPLIATAVIYFLVANLLALLLSKLEVQLDPKRRKRTVKGVVIK